MLTISKHSHRIGYRQDFLHAMRDIDDRNAFLRQFANHLKQAVRFVDGQRRGRFVHDQDPRLCHQSFCDLHQLLLTNPQSGHRQIDPTMKIQRA